MNALLKSTKPSRLVLALVALLALSAGIASSRNTATARGNGNPDEIRTTQELLTPPDVITILEIDVENIVRYVEDVPPNLFATNPNITMAAEPKNFGSQVVIGDIVAVNGEPAKGTLVNHARTVNLRPTPTPGQAIADTNRNEIQYLAFEILNADGTPIGTIMIVGFAGGPPPPGAPSEATQSNNAIVGGTGAFLGARGYFGQVRSSQTVPARRASMAEDPARRRENGGGKNRFVLQVILSKELTKTLQG